MMTKLIKTKTKSIILTLVFLLIGGCSANFTYNNIGWLSSFWIDDYIDLNKQQSKELKSLIKDTRDWHRETQLPLYKKDLTNLQKLLKQNPTEVALVNHFVNAKQHWQTFTKHIVGPLITIAKTLNEEQRLELVASIAKQIEEDEQEFLEQTPQERTQERLDKQLDKYQDWLGKLSAQQVSLITDANNDFQSTFTLWQEYKRRRLNKFKNLVHTMSITDEEFDQQLAFIILNREAFMSEELIELDNQNLKSYAKLLISLRVTLTDKQVAHANEKMNELIEEIDDLIEG